jgi:methyl-accepting chemotaxis protein
MSMKWFNNLKVAVKVLICCMVFIIMLVGGSIYAVRSISQTEKDIDIFYGDRVKPTIWGNDMYKNVLQARVNMFAVIEALQTKNTKEINARIDDYRSRKAQNEKLWAQYVAIPKNNEEQKLADKFAKDYASMIDEFELFVKAAQKEDMLEVNKINDIWVETYRKARDSMDAILAYQVKAGEEMINVNKANSARTRMFLYILLGFSTFAGIIITIVLARSVSGPVGKGLAFAQKLAAGDFTDRIDLDQKDELGQLGKALNTAADDLEKMVAGIVVSSQNLVQAIQEISAGNENLSQRTSEQASSLEEVASTIEETTASINQNAENAKNANDLAAKTSESAEEGGRVVYGAVDAINEINEASKKIEEIISVINDISFQTNLLALNAAVEAARAGEQGRGFAVVAGEVRNLAQRSGAAAKEIGALIKSTITKVDKGTSLANKSGEALKGIIVAVKNVGNLVSEINASSEEQKQGAQQINIAISELDSMTQQNAGLVEETASASEEIANQAQELLATMEKFKIRDQLRVQSQGKSHKEIHLHGTAAKGKIVAAHKEEPKAAPSVSGAVPKNQKEIDKILSQDGFEQF